MSDHDPSTAKATLKSRTRAALSKKLTDEALVAVAVAANALDKATYHWSDGEDRRASRMLMEHIDDYLEERGTHDQTTL
jgi:hypothetical protein